MAGNRNSGRHRMPVSVIKGTGMTADEKAGRQRVEGIRGSTAIVVPDWIEDEDVRSEFMRYADYMNEIGTWSERYDAELAAFVTAKALYQRFSLRVERMLKHGAAASDIKPASVEQDRAFRQMHSAATALGLNVSGHLKLAGTKEEPEKERLVL